MGAQLGSDKSRENIEIAKVQENRISNVKKRRFTSLKRRICGPLFVKIISIGSRKHLSAIWTKNWTEFQTKKKVSSSILEELKLEL